MRQQYPPRKLAISPLPNPVLTIFVGHWGPALLLRRPPMDALLPTAVATPQPGDQVQVDFLAPALVPVNQPTTLLVDF